MAPWRVQAAGGGGSREVLPSRGRGGDVGRRGEVDGGGGNVARYAKCAKLTLLLRALTVALPAASVGIVGLLARLAAARMMNGKCENC